MSAMPSAGLATVEAGISMSRRLWRCRNRACPEPHGTVLGRLLANHGLLIEDGSWKIECYLDTRRVAVTCPACGARRDYYGNFVIIRSEPRRPTTMDQL